MTLLQRPITSKTLHFENGLGFTECQNLLAFQGRDWRRGYFEWDGYHFFWTPSGSEQHERTANPMG